MEDQQLKISENNQFKHQITVSPKEQQAQYYYQYFKKHSIKSTKMNSIEQYIEKYPKQEDFSYTQNQEKVQSTELQAKNIKISEYEALLILKGLSDGKNIGQIQRQNSKIHQYPMSKLKNVAKLTLQRLSKIFVDLLPNNIIQLNSKQFYEKYFRTKQMLQFYKTNGLQLLPTFQNLFFIKDWEKENKQYLKRGYSRDYLPDEIRNKLAALPSVYQAIKQMYDHSGGSLKTKQKRKFVKKSSLSIQNEENQEDQFMQSEKAQSQ